MENNKRSKHLMTSEDHEKLFRKSLAVKGYNDKEITQMILAGKFHDAACFKTNTTNTLREDEEK